MLSVNDLQSINLVKSHVTSTATTQRKCLAVYPQKKSKKLRQRVAVGDKTGSVRVFSMGKLQDVSVTFETPATNTPVGRTTVFKDQLFFATGAVVEAYTKKGRVFFRFETAATEPLTKLFIYTPYIFAAGEYMASTYNETKEIGFVMAPDKINDMDVFGPKPPVGDASPEPGTIEDHFCCLGCNDRQIRVVRNNKVVLETGVEAAISVLQMNASRKLLWYGTNAGSFGSLRCVGGSQPSLSPCGENVIPDKRKSAVTAITSADVDQDGEDEIIVCREDGSVEVFSTRALDNGSYGVAWKDNIGESVMSVDTGLLTNVEQVDVIVHTFSGSVCAFTRRKDDPAAVPVPNPVTAKRASLASMTSTVKSSHSANGGEPSAVQIVDAQVKATKEELQGLKAQVTQCAEDLAAEQRRQAALKSEKAAAVTRAVASTFTTRCTLEPVGVDGALELVVAIDAPLDCVGIHCDVPLRLVASETTMLSVSKDGASAENGDDDLDAIPLGIREGATTKVLAVARPTDTKAQQVRMQLWAPEGYAGVIRVTVLAQLFPKTAQVKDVLIHPLPLHLRCGVSTAERDPNSVSRLVITGEFSSRDVHRWLSRIFPGVLEVFQQTKRDPLAFQHAFDGTAVLIKYDVEGKVVCTSTSLTTLVILQSAFTSFATERSIEVTPTITANYVTPYTHLRLLTPLLAREGSIGRSLRLLHGLRDLQGNEDDALSLPQEYQQLLETSGEIERESPQHQLRLAQLLAVVGSLMKAVWLTLRGTSAPREVLKQVRDAITNSDNALESLIPLFFPNKEHVEALRAAKEGRKNEQGGGERKKPREEDDGHSEPQQTSSTATESAPAPESNRSGAVEPPTAPPAPVPVPVPESAPEAIPEAIHETVPGPIPETVPETIHNPSDAKQVCPTREEDPS